MRLFQQAKKHSQRYKVVGMSAEDKMHFAHCFHQTGILHSHGGKGKGGAYSNAVIEFDDYWMGTVVFQHVILEKA